MPNLFIASGIFHPESGGPASYLKDLLPALQARGWSVRVLTYGDADTSAYTYPVTRVPRRALPLRLSQYAAAAQPHLRWADVVYVHTIDLPLLSARQAPRIIKIVGDQAWERCIRKGWIPPDEDIDAFQSKSYGGIVQQQKRSRTQQVRAMDGVIVPSAYLKQMVMGWGVPEARIQVIYNALPSVNAPTPSQREARTQLGLDEGPWLLSAARLERWKGVDHVIEALQHVPEARLLVIGDGEDRQRLEDAAQAIGDRVRFLGWVSRDELALYMRAADYLVLYSGYEGLSHTLLESLHVGTPVIASAKGGNPEIVQQGVNGWLVPHVEVATLASTIQQALLPGVRERFAQQAATGLRRFAFDTMIARTDEALRVYL